MKAETKITFEDGSEFIHTTENMSEPETDSDPPTSDIEEVLGQHIFQIGQEYELMLHDEEMEKED